VGRGGSEKQTKTHKKTQNKNQKGPLFMGGIGPRSFIEGNKTDIGGGGRRLREVSEKKKKKKQKKKKQKKKTQQKERTFTVGRE